MLRKSKARGFFLPLSGGLDSCSVALLTYNMCFLLYNQIKLSDQSEEILGHLRNILQDKDYTPKSPQELCKRLLFTVYLSTQNSSN